MAITDSIFQSNLDERMTLDGALVTDFVNLKVLVANTGANAHATFRVQGQTSGYQVPAGKQFRSIGMSVNNFQGSAISLGIMTAESDVGFDSGSAPSNPDVASVATQNELQATAVDSPRDYQIIIPAAHYGYMYATGAGTVYLYGYEESVS